VVHVRSDGWIDIIKACQDSGQTVKQWCSENNVNEGSVRGKLNLQPVSIFFNKTLIVF